MPVTDIPLNGGKSTIQYSRDFYGNWDRVNPILQEGEVVIVYTNSERTKYRMKIGDGVRNWRDLPYREPIVSDTLGIGMVPAVSQRAITEGLERVESIISIFKYQEVI